MAEQEQTPIRFTPTDRSLIDSLKEYLGMPSVASVVRYLIRDKARALGLTVLPGEPRPPGRPRKKRAPR